MENENQIWLNLLDSYGLELIGMESVEKNLYDFNQSLELAAKRKPFEGYQQKDERKYLKLFLKEGRSFLKIKNPATFILKNQHVPFKKALPSFCYKAYTIRLGLPIGEEVFEVKGLHTKSLSKILGENSEEAKEIEMVFSERIKTDKAILLKMRFDVDGYEKMVGDVLYGYQKEIEKNISKGNALQDFFEELNKLSEQIVEKRSAQLQ